MESWGLALAAGVSPVLAGAADVLAQPGIGALLDSPAGQQWLQQLAPGCVDSEGVSAGRLPAVLPVIHPVRLGRVNGGVLTAAGADRHGQALPRVAAVSRQWREAPRYTRHAQADFGLPHRAPHSHHPGRPLSTEALGAVEPAPPGHVLPDAIERRLGVPVYCVSVARVFHRQT
jgi:hypothetical protein